MVAALSRRYAASHIPQVEEIQDMVEETLILLEFARTAKAYILYRHERALVREKAAAVPEEVVRLTAESKKHFSDVLSEFIYYRTYSRWIEDKKRRETWVETVDRYFDFMREKLGDRLRINEYEELRQAILHQQVMPSMRLLWSAGPAARGNNIAAYNCSFVAPTTLDDLADIMYLLMSGVGVGFSVESQHVQKLPIIERQTGIVLSPPPGRGYQGRLGRRLEGRLAAPGTKAKDLRFDFSLVRPAGARLKTMGGRSSGPAPLRALLDFARGKILSCQGRRLDNIDLHDIICKIGEVVERGGVRRAALISLSDFDDEEMREAKSGHFYISQPQRAMANNSAVYNRKPKAVDFLREWLHLARGGTGERGIFNRSGLESQMPARRWRLFSGASLLLRHQPLRRDNPPVPTVLQPHRSGGPAGGHRGVAYGKDPSCHHPRHLPGHAHRFPIHCAGVAAKTARRRGSWASRSPASGIARRFGMPASSPDCGTMRSAPTGTMPNASASTRPPR